MATLKIITIIVLGLASGSFINAFVWRWHEKKDWVKDRSECVRCHHKLGFWDLVPVASWVFLRGKCRYCGKGISAQYPLVEILTAGLFLGSYIYWPYKLSGVNVADFLLWLVILTGLVILAVYDIKWMLLPNKIIAAFTIPAAIMAILNVLVANNSLLMALNYTGGVLVGGGVFYLVFIISKGQWIGGGDIKLGFLLGLIAGSIQSSFLMIFLSALLGSLISIPMLVTHKAKRTSKIPYGPFLILGLYVVQLFGVTILNWYYHSFMGL